jgi:hypothetical protein
LDIGKKARKPHAYFRLQFQFDQPKLVLGLDRADGATVFARTAIDAGVCVNYIDTRVTESDRANGASIGARAACYAFI